MLAIIVPAFNEEKKIGRVLRDLFEHGYSNVVVVDDGSRDKTGLIAKEAGAKVITHILNRGQGAALQTGNEFALSNGAQTIVHFDADGQFKAEDINFSLMVFNEGNYDAILGSRFLDRRSQVPLTKKYLIIPVARFINFLITGVWLTDAHNGFRVLSAHMAKKIKIRQDGMAHNTEIVRQLKKNNFNFIECPIKVIYDEYGQNVFGGLKILSDLIKSKLFN
jgi:glycosyltransferase involved in cell wall biosynthesis